MLKLKVSHQLSRLNEVLQDQNSAIRDLNNRVTRLADEVDDMRNPNYDKIFAYVDKQVGVCPQYLGHIILFCESFIDLSPACLSHHPTVRCRNYIQI